MERSLRSVFHPGLPHYRISPFISSQKTSWPDDGGQWKLGSVLLSKLFPTLKWAINSPVWRENNVSGGLLQSRLSFRAEMEKCVRWCHLRLTQKTNKSNNLQQILIKVLNQCVLSCPGPTQRLRQWQWSVIMADTCSTQVLYCKYAFTLKTHREREKPSDPPSLPICLSVSCAADVGKCLCVM